MCFKQKKKGKSKVLSGGFCLRDSKVEQRSLQFLHIHRSNVNSYSSAPELDNKIHQTEVWIYPYSFIISK